MLTNFFNKIKNFLIENSDSPIFWACLVVIIIILFKVVYAFLNKEK